MSLLERLTMGCLCTRESIAIDARRFYVRQRLGDGGFSVVDLVEDSRTHKLYAVKRIPCHSAGDEQIAQQEVKYMSAVKHPNLVPCEAQKLLKLESTGPALNMSAISEMLIVMPYYWKGCLQSELVSLSRRHAHMEERRLVRILTGVCEGLQALHTAATPLAHRDIKPHNVMYEHDDAPVLMDFGSMGSADIEIKSSRDALKLQDFAAERCSMPYRAPELFTVDSNCVISAKTDIWSLGCMMYAMCFYESPFDAVYQRGDSIALAVMAKITIPSNQYSNDITELISAMLTVDPSERPDTHWVLQRLKHITEQMDNRV